ncbi:spore coat protein YsxE, partial [Geobacillus thermodenitrificans]
MAIRSETYRAVLHQYGLQPQRIEQRGKAAKVYTDRGIFALKMLDGEQEAAAIWQSLHYYGRHCPPVYWTRHRSLFAAEGGRLYYLHAWQDGEARAREETVRAFFHGLSRLHRATVRTVEVSEEEV